MPTLSLGVLDIPYSAAGKTKTAARDIAKHLKEAGAGSANGKTTGDIAEILEAKYHIMGNFYDAHQDEIVQAITETMGDALQDALSGSPVSLSNSMGAAMSDIQTMFNKFVDSGEMEGMGVEGVPTKAALKGVNHRLKHPYSRNNPRRPSFKDTGLYEQSFRAEIKE